MFLRCTLIPVSVKANNFPMASRKRSKVEQYGLWWDDFTPQIQREIYCLERGGRWQRPESGQWAGEGLFHHFKEFQKLLWPDDDHHRWSDLALQTFLDEDITVMLGSGDSNKTYSMARFVLCDWWIFPHRTLWLVSSTELRGAELRILGKLKELFNRARRLHPWLPGRFLESYHAITAEKISEDQSEGRMLTNGIIFIPCKQGGRWIGMGAYAGIKPTRNGRLGHCGDEVSFMQKSFLDGYSNWYGKPNFKGLMAANPFDLEDPSCVAAEPVEGWNAWEDSGKTQTWRSKFFNAFVIAFDGRDSPNDDYPADQPTKFPYLIGPKKRNAISTTHGKDSWQWWNQCVGKPRSGMLPKRVLSRQLCEKGKAFDQVIWADVRRTKIAGCDAAYGGVGGDRCIGGHAEFGKDVEGRDILCIYPLVIVPVSVKKTGLPEDQIAEFMKEYCEGYDIPPQNFFFDARATMAMAFARIWSPMVEAVDFGGKPTERPVTHDTYIWEGDKRTRRLQRCDELYSKFVTELWLSVHYVILSGQMRQLPKDAAEEGYKRQWKYTTGNRIEVEPKDEMKLRTQESPDLMDCVVTITEGARRRGFQIRSLANPDNVWRDDKWKDDLRERADKVRKSFELQPV